MDFAPTDSANNNYTFVSIEHFYKIPKRTRLQNDTEE